MALTVTMPQLGESVTEGTIARWIKQPGEAVGRYEAIAEVTTDKVNAEIPSPAAGTMGEHLVEEGAVVPVGGEICRIEGAGVAGDPAPAAAGATGGPPAAVPGPSATATAEIPPPPPVAPPPAAPAAPPPAAPAAPPAAAAAAAAAAPQPVEVPSPRPPAANGSGAESLHVTPAVRMLAREHGIDLAEVAGTGLGGRVTKRDVLAYVQQQLAAGAAATTGPSVPARAAAAAATPVPAAPAAAAPTPAIPAELGSDTLMPATGARRAIAEHMVRSRRTAPHAWTLVEVDMSAVARVRAANRAGFREATGADLTFLPFVARAVVSALRRTPTLNATWTDDGIILKRDINLGIAVALEGNLIVPVLQHAEDLNIAGLARALSDLTARARGGRLRIDELGGGTFTLNNAGAVGTLLSQAIINQPQAAICVMDGIVKRPVVVDDAIAIRSMMNLSLSFDHRINDGLQATRFLVDVKRQLEDIDEAAPLL